MHNIIADGSNYLLPLFIIFMFICENKIIFGVIYKKEKKNQEQIDEQRVAIKRMKRKTRISIYLLENVANKSALFEGKFHY